MKKVILCSILAFHLASCNKVVDEKTGNVIKAKLASQNIDPKHQINRLDVYSMTGDVLTTEHINISAEEGGLYPINAEQRENTVLVFIANGDNVPLNQIAGSTTYTELLSKSTPAADYLLSQPVMYYTGSNDISTISDPMLSVDMTKSMARLDLKIQTETNIVIDSCVISNITDRAYIFPSEKLLHPEAKLISTTLKDDQITATATTPQEEFLFLYESEGANSKANFHVRINNVKNILEVSLPTKINRNRKYLITINSSGATLYSSLVVLPWEDGGDLEAKPKPFAPLIDTVNSDFPEIVTISKTQDTIFIPPSNLSGTLVIDADIETELTTDSNIVIEPILPTSKATYTGNKFRVSFKHKNINDPKSYSRIYIKNKNASQHHGEHIIVAQHAYRTSFANFSEFGTVEGSDVNYNGYTDGEIGDFIYTETPDSVTCESSDPDFNWLKIDETDPEKPQLHGVFKPNDLGANGQTQISTVKVAYSDGLTEEFTFTRKRESIPTVFISGRHWAKHNMRGNSKKYEDQISVTKDVDDLFEYLKTCSDEDYMYYSGANYKGRSHEGMYLHKDTATLKLSYNNYSKYAAEALSNASPYLHCPDGYSIPSFEEIGSILHKTGNFGLPADGSPVGYNSSTNVRYTIERHKRDTITIDGVGVSGITHAKITEDTSGTSLTFAGTGQQYSNTGVNLNSVIIGMIYPSKTSYFTFEHGTNSATVKFQSSTNTRNIRCIKLPVKHII